VSDGGGTSLVLRGSRAREVRTDRVPRRLMQEVPRERRAVRSSGVGAIFSRLESTAGVGGPDGIEPASLASNHHRKFAHRRGKPTVGWSSELCPRLCPNGCLASRNTVTYGQTSTDIFRGEVVEAAAEKVIQCVSTLLQRIAFQACSFNHSDISPFRINHLQTTDRAESDLCSDCALTCRRLHRF
jgi:hypothetical protein